MIYRLLPVRVVLLALFATFYVGAAWGDPSQATDAPLRQAGDSVLTKSLGPFKISAGPDNNGNFGATLNGDGRRSGCIGSCFSPQTPPPMDVSRFWYPANWYLGYAADGSWSSDTKSANNGSLSLKPGIDGALFYGPFSTEVDPNKPAPTCTQSKCSIPPATYPRLLAGVGVYADVEYRSGTFQSGGTSSKARQALGGGGVYLAIPTPNNWNWMQVWPRLSATFYAPFHTQQIGDASSVLPAGAKENFIQSELHTAIAFGAKGWKTQDAEDYPFKLDVVYDGSQPTTGANKSWTSLWKLQLSTSLFGNSGVQPVVSYQSGTQGSFKYDRQFLFGALVQFLDPNAGK